MNLARLEYFFRLICSRVGCHGAARGAGILDRAGGTSDHRGVYMAGEWVGIGSRCVGRKHRQAGRVPLALAIASLFFVSISFIRAI